MTSFVLAVNAKNDLYLSATGDLATADGLTAVMQAAAQAAKTQLGEMIYATDQGLPNFAAVWNGSPNLSQFEAYLRRALLAVTDVTGIESLDVTIAAGVVSYRAVIRTIYGLGVVNG